MGWFCHTWHYVNDPDTTTSKILKARYYPNTYFWNATIVTKIHLFWSAILNIKKHLEKNVTIHIVDGNTCFLNQPW
jgi:hypothetical protein